MKQIIMLVILSVGCQVIYMLPYLTNSIYALFQEATGYTNTQMGNLMSLYGICAVFGYFFSGLLADRFSTKWLMVIGLFGTGIIGSVVAFIPPYPVMVAIYIGYGFFAILVYWTALVKAIRSLGDESVQGRLFGYWGGIAGAAGLIVGFAGVAMLGLYSDTMMSFRANIFIRSGITILIGIITLITYKDKKEIGASNGSGAEQKKKYTAKEVFEVLRLPQTWMCVLIVLGVYFVLCGCTYFAPYLLNFDASLMVSTVFGNIRQILPLIGASIAGIIVDRQGTCFKTILGSLLIVIASSLILAVLPTQAGLLGVVVVVCLVLGLFNQFAKNMFYLPIEEAKFPERFYGVIVGFVSAIGYAPDAFFYTVAGNFIDRFGVAGYRGVFIFMALSSVVAFVCAAVLWKQIRKKGKEVPAA